eukprot:1527472-Pyramimonas_sp.AAC.1
MSWKFVSPLVLEDHKGLEVVLPSTSPAKVLCDLRAAWMHMMAAKAASKFRHPGEPLDTTACCQLLSPGSILSYAEKCMLKADDLHHRLFACSATISVRDECLKEDVADFTSRQDKKNPLMLGFHLVPESILRPPDGFGHE